MVDPLKKNQLLFFQTALPLIGKYGLTQTLLEETSLKLNHSPMYGNILFPYNPTKEFAKYMMHWWNEQLSQALHQPDLIPLKINQRIFKAIQTHLQLIEPHKDAFRKLHHYYCHPCHTKEASILAWQTADCIWNLCNDTSTDFNYYSKRALLLAVHTSTFIYWLNDHSNHHEKSWEFLQHRIENVLLIGKFKRQILNLLPHQQQ